MICCELISNKFDLREQRDLLHILSSPCLEYRDNSVVTPKVPDSAPDPVMNQPN